MKSIVLTAGQGTRLEPLTDCHPKAMITICGQPLLARLLTSFSRIGCHETAVVINPRHRSMVNRFDRLVSPALPSITWFEQTEGLGVGNGVLAARTYIDTGEYFMLSYGDIMFSDNLLQSLLNSFNSIRKPVAAVCLTRDSSDFGVIYMDQEMRITEIIEKPQQRKLGNYVLAGAFILPGGFISVLADCGGNIIDAFTKFLHSSELYASIWEGEWIDIAYPWSVLAANQMLMREWHQTIQSTSIVIESGVNISGPVVIEDHVTIKSGASIIGPCFIGQNSFIGHHALLRDCTCIGAGSTIGFGVEVKNSVIMAGSEIGRLSFIGDSVIGEHVEVGSATIMVNVRMDQATVSVDICGEPIDSGLKKLGSFIGDHAWIGANHTFLPGTKIPAHHVIPHFGTYPPRQ
ncbi:NTP transferase domain-containing protein [bacterium]|nr:NTP transferase domain-containing protein [candidate division CSSED10-310 bacterium]